MKRSMTAALAAVLMTVMLVLAGCSSWLESPAKPANDAIALANTHLKKAATLGDEITSKGATLQALPYTGAGAKEAVTIIKDVKKSLDTERTELLAAKAAMDGIAKLEVDDSFKQYAKLEAAAIDGRVALVDGQARLYDVMNRMYAALSKKSSSNADVQEMITAIQAMQEEVAALAETASQAAAEAADFFTTNRLGG